MQIAMLFDFGNSSFFQGLITPISRQANPDQYDNLYINIFHILDDPIIVVCRFECRKVHRVKYSNTGRK